MIKNLVFIGDSLTQWCNWEKRFPAHSVINLGIAGETVEGLLGRRERIRTMVENPDMIFLMTGINNLAMEHYDILVPYEEIVRNLCTWYKHATIVVQSILPVNMEWISNDVIKDVNQNLMMIARDHRAEYLDLHRLFIDPEGRPIRGYLLDDGVHVSTKGYDAWANAVERIISSQR